MHRRAFFTTAAFALLPRLFADEAPAKPATLRGKLDHTPDGKPALRDGAHLIPLAGDEPTTKVLLDSRLAGEDFEVIGHWDGPLFRVDPIHTKAMFVNKNGRKLAITYWCDICYIRTYSPGKCWCCQNDTKLDLIPPEDLPR